MATFRYPTIVSVVASGSIVQGSGPVAAYDPPLKWGPAGTGPRDGQAQIDMRWTSAAFPSYSSAWIATTNTPTEPSYALVAGDVVGLRTPLRDPQPYGGPTWSCGVYQQKPCWIYQGASEIVITRMPATLTLVSNASAPVKNGQEVRFSMASEPVAYAGTAVEMFETAWRWQPDAPTGTDSVTRADTTACASIVDRGKTCVRNMVRSGTIFVRAYVNGVEQEKSVHVDVKPKPTIKLTVSMDSVNAGDTVLVTATITGADRDSIRGYTYGPETGQGTCFTVKPAPKVCTLIPRASGRMRVSALGDGEELSGDTPVVVRDPKLKLVCDGSWKFAEVASCAATRDDGKAPEVTGWSFTGPDGELARARDVTSTVWTGEIVRSGLVRVMAKVGNSVQSATGSVLVTITRTRIEDVPHTEVDSSAAPSNPTAFDPPKGGLLGQMDPLAEIDSTRMPKPIADGPNTGYSYFRQMPVKVRHVTFLNNTAMKKGSAFSLKQLGPTFTGTSSVDPSYKKKMCTGEFVYQGLPGLVRAHEGSSVNDAISHVQTFYRPFNDTLNVALANQVKLGAMMKADVQPAIRSSEVVARRMSINATHNADVDPIGYKLIPCYLVF